ncbi:hypothetical protein FWF89_02300 [Candidatus Saccharibacteria bacterium]|nr:hypothetical protein [Candidatus Saccharibacteria bacterium]
MKKAVKASVAVGSLLMAIAIVTVGVISLLSDIVTNNGLFKAVPNTSGLELDIGGRYEMYRGGSNYEGVVTESGGYIEMAPGDIMVLKATITSYGPASAWVRDILDYGGSNVDSFLRYGCGELTVEDFLQPTFEEDQISVGCMAELSGDSGQWTGTVRTPTQVLNGISETENDSNAPGPLKLDTNYSSDLFIGTTSYEAIFTVWFDPDIATSGNEIIWVVLKTEAMQYRENNSHVPMNYNDVDWQEVVLLPVGIIY